MCYAAARKSTKYVYINTDCEQRNYFSFYNYEYNLDVSKQYALMMDVKPMKEGLKEAFAQCRAICYNGARK